MYSSANSYRLQAQALTFLFCGANIIALSASTPQEISYGPQKSVNLNRTTFSTDYKASTPSVVPSVRQAYKASESSLIDNRLVVSVVGFYDKLLSNQTSMGSEINNIINDSLWDLYSD